MPMCSWPLGSRTKWLLGSYTFPMSRLCPGRKGYVRFSLGILFIHFGVGRDSCQNHHLITCFCILLTADIISTVEFNDSGDLLATGDKGGRVVIFQREQEVSNYNAQTQRHRSATHSASPSLASFHLDAVRSH